MKPEIGCEKRINESLGVILRNFNFLELNMGLCIRFLENVKEPERSHSKLARTSITEKLELLRSLLESKNLITDLEEFERWYKEVREARCIRNYYVHGTWEYLPLIKEKPLSFRLPPWRTETLKGETKVAMSLEQLEADANQIEKAFVNFMELRRKYNV